MASGKGIVSAVTLRNNIVEWTSVRAKKGDAEIHDSQRVALDLSEEAGPGSPEMSAAVKATCRRIPNVHLSLPSSQVLMRVVSLPSSDPAEIEGMVELQVDKFSPFPIDRMSVSFEILSREENSSRVLIAATQRENVESLGAVFQGAEILPRAIDLEVMGWWELMRAKGCIEESGLQVILLLDESSTELVIAQDGLPVLFRSLLARGEEPDETFVTEVAEETAYTLTTLESEVGGDVLHITCWSWDAVPENMLESLEVECGVKGVARSLDELPPLTEGLARRALRRQPAVMDLAPQDWHATEKSRAAKKKLLAATFVFLVLWLGAVGGLWVYLNLQATSYEKLHATSQSLGEPAQEVRRLRSKVQALEQFSDRSRSALECLLEVTVLLPEGVEISSFNYKKGRAVSLRGQAKSANPIYDFFEALEKSELFTKTDAGGITTKNDRGERLSEFKVTCQLPEEEE
ncbi:MAG: pilus assembly protein PilM [Verrucomicrobia bacterium]|nr:pilus assembly protein PilM [Verrucomicrobiota bacterium]